MTALNLHYLRILHLAASTMEQRVEAALDKLLGAGTSFDFETVRALAAALSARPGLLATPTAVLVLLRAR